MKEFCTKNGGIGFVNSCVFRIALLHQWVVPVLTNVAL